MATPNLKRSTAPSGQPRRGSRLGRRILQTSGLAAIALAALYWHPLREMALANSASAARIACSCRHVSGRELGECRGDLESGAAWVLLSEDEEAASVIARIPGLASQTAHYRSGQGCVLDRWDS